MKTKEEIEKLSIDYVLSLSVQENIGRKTVQRAFVYAYSEAQAYHEDKTRELNNELQNLKNELAEIKPCKHFGLEKRTDDTVEYFCANCGIKL